MMAKRQRVDSDLVTEAPDPKVEEAKAKEPKAEEPKVEKAKAKKKREPLDRSTLKPEAVEHLVKGDVVKEKLEVAAVALEELGLEGTAKRMWKEAERAYAAAEREVRRIQKTGNKAEREAAKKMKKQEKIAKLRKQLEELMAAEAKGSDNA